MGEIIDKYLKYMQKKANPMGMTNDDMADRMMIQDNAGARSAFDMAKAPTPQPKGLLGDVVALGGDPQHAQQISNKLQGIKANIQGLNAPIPTPTPAPQSKGLLGDVVGLGGDPQHAQQISNKLQGIKANIQGLKLK